MRWDPTTRGWAAKWRKIEAAHDNMAAGRLCGEADCFARSVVGVMVHIGGRRIEAGLCAPHHRELLAHLEQRGRPQPDGTVLLGRRRIGGSRLLGKGEILDGPLAPGELKDE